MRSECASNDFLITSIGSLMLNKEKRLEWLPDAPTGHVVVERLFRHT